jgi:multiple sugar transport system substrate-binding protein
MRLKKFVFVLLTMLLVMSVLAGCLGSGNSGSSDSRGGDSSASGGNSGGGGGKHEVTIRIASAETSGAVMQVWEEAGKEYEQLTGVKVVAEAVPLTEIYTKINATYGTSAQYSMFTTGFIGHISLFQEQGWLAEVDDLIEALGGKEDFDGGDILFPINGKTYWIPYDYNNAIGFIRKDWLEEKGLEVPTNWDELLNVVRAFTDKANNRYGILMPLKSDDSTNWVTSQVLWANDVRIFDDNWNVILDSPEMKPKVVESLNLLKELYKYMPARADNATYGDLTESFISEQVGITFYTGRIIDFLDEQNPALGDKFQLFGFPKKDGGGITAGFGYDGMAILNTDHVDETKKFVEWFYKEKLVDMYATGANHFYPVQKSFFENEKWRNLPLVSKYWDVGMNAMRELFGKADMHSIDTDGPEISQISGGVFQSMVFPKMYQRVTINDEDPGKVVDVIAQEIREMIK